MKEQTIENLFGTLTLEEKIAQLMVLGYTGTFVEPELTEFIGKYGLGGLRTSPILARKFKRYLPEGSPGIQNVNRPPSLLEKQFDMSINPWHVTPQEYATTLNDLRTRAFTRRSLGLPMHVVIDYESGAGSNYLPKGMISTPAPMAFGHHGDLDLIREAFFVVNRQLKAIGFDINQCPVVDVNTNPNNPECYTRSFSEKTDVCINCARAMLEAMRRANMIGCLKHFPGRGPSGEDAHFGISSINLKREEMYRYHLEPYRVLAKENMIPSIMPAHSVYPTLDPSEEIATVSKRMIQGILRDEFGFDGVITTDSMTMGGLMAKYSVGEACVLALEAGVDLLLLKDENVLRYELMESVVKAVESGRLSEERIHQSLRRVWSLKYDYGLFANGGVVDVKAIEGELINPEYHRIGLKAARETLTLSRDNEKLLPLRKEEKILVVDTVLFVQKMQNDSWNHPGMLWEFMLKQSPSVAYVDYTADTMEDCHRRIEAIIGQIDKIVVTADFTRGEKCSGKDFVRSLKKYGKPIIMVSTNPYEELLIPDDIGTVIVSYGLMRESSIAISEYLYRGEVNCQRQLNRKTDG